MKMETIITDVADGGNNAALALINAMYRYYEKPQNNMTVGELYLLLKMIITKLEDEFENMDIRTLNQ
ncbi:MAG: hypothetical protein IJQ90_01555 [Alphaproteobacteria bacterium]|nr:hypothetical protein [Alphaproteobacteria bacterium]